MLTTSYSIIALANEQKNARRILSKLRQCLHDAAWQETDNSSLQWLETAFNKLMMIERYCHERKIERYVIPAIRKATIDADALLAKLDALSEDAGRILRYACDQLQRATGGIEVDIEMLIAVMDLYCQQVLERLTLEEQELFPIARRLLTDEEWLRLAACCLLSAQRIACRREYAPNVHGHGRHRYRYVH